MFSQGCSWRKQTAEMTSLQVQPHARARVQLLGADAADQVARRGHWAANEPRAVDPRQLVKQKLQACWQKLCSFDSRPGSLCFLQEQPWENVP